MKEKFILPQFQFSQVYIVIGGMFQCLQLAMALL